MHWNILSWMVSMLSHNRFNNKLKRKEKEKKS